MCVVNGLVRGKHRDLSAKYAPAYLAKNREKSAAYEYSTYLIRSPVGPVANDCKDHHEKSEDLAERVNEVRNFLPDMSE